MTDSNNDEEMDCGNYFTEAAFNEDEANWDTILNFNSDGYLLDEDGNVVDDDYRFKDDFEYEDTEEYDEE